MNIDFLSIYVLMLIAYIIGYILNGAFKSASPWQYFTNIVCCILWPVMFLLAVAVWAYGVISSLDCPFNHRH